MVIASVKSTVLRVTLFTTLLFTVGCGSNFNPVNPPSVQAASTLQQQIAAGGTITLPAGTVNIDCAGQLAINKSTALIGAGRDLTILHDTCATGDTVFVDLTNPANVRLEELAIVHDGGSSTVRLIGGNHGYTEILRRVLRLSNVELSGATNCLVSDGLNQLFIEKSNLLHCSQDGAQIGSFGVTLHDNWFGENGRNGVSFVDSPSGAVDEQGGHLAGFCASCSGNEYWHNKGHGFVYQLAIGTADARHIGEYVDSNGDVGFIATGLRDFTFNDGWVGSNQHGGAIIGSTAVGTVLVGNTFTVNFGTNVDVTQTAGPLHISGNVSSLPQSPCDLRINGGPCVDLNKQ